MLTHTASVKPYPSNIRHLEPAFFIASSKSCCNLVGNESPPQKTTRSFLRFLFLINSGHFSKLSYIVGTPQMQETSTLFIIFAASLGENFGINITANLVINGACIVMHKPNPWNDGKTVSIPPPLISSGLQASISQACSATKLRF